MTRRRTVVVAAAAIALVAVAAAVALTRPSSSGSSGSSDEDAGPVPPHQGRFVVECSWSHAAPADPIVHYGMEGMSHLHEFFGAVGVNASTTVDDLVEADTTCRNKEDRASYWAPALYDGDRRIEPSGSNAYYRAAPGVDPATVVPFPLGLKMLGGDQFSTEEQDTAIVGWSCGFNPRRHAAPPDCGEGSPLRVRITYPDCWDGERLDDPIDHTSHMAYSDADGCPDSHPVAVPQLEFIIEYPFHGDASSLRLASGETFTAHADFFNAWDPEALATDVRYCINADVVCGVAQLGPHGT